MINRKSFAVIFLRTNTNSFVVNAESELGHKVLAVQSPFGRRSSSLRLNKHTIRLGATKSKVHAEYSIALEQINSPTWNLVRITLHDDAMPVHGNRRQDLGYSDAGSNLLLQRRKHPVWT
jgi:hypothetical protein